MCCAVVIVLEKRGAVYLYICVCLCACACVQGWGGDGGTIPFLVTNTSCTWRSGQLYCLRECVLGEGCVCVRTGIKMKDAPVQ